jgi:hypothetical protein
MHMVMSHSSRSGWARADPQWGTVPAAALPRGGDNEARYSVEHNRVTFGVPSTSPLRRVRIDLDNEELLGERCVVHTTVPLGATTPVAPSDACVVVRPATSARTTHTVFSTARAMSQALASGQHSTETPALSQRRTCSRSADSGCRGRDGHLPCGNLHAVDLVGHDAATSMVSAVVREESACPEHVYTFRTVSGGNALLPEHLRDADPTRPRSARVENRSRRRSG